MAAVGIKELKVHTSEILRRVRDQREPIDVTLRGRVIARLVPVERPHPTTKELDQWWEKHRSLAEEISEHWPEGVSAVDAVREDRREL